MDEFTPVLRTCMDREPLGLMCDHRDDKVQDKTAYDMKNYLPVIQEFNEGGE
jgi:hypothetical protein